jgi:hypothetical protein
VDGAVVGLSGVDNGLICFGGDSANVRRRLRVALAHLKTVLSAPGFRADKRIGTQAGGPKEFHNPLDSIRA